MNWTPLTDPAQLDEILTESGETPVLIYKHSTRCNISRATFDRLIRNWDDDSIGKVKRYFLDLISYREISNRIAEMFEVEHQSPQLLVIAGGKSVLDLSHYDIDFESIRAAVAKSN